MTRRIQVGQVPVGGGAAVSIQSMCNTPTEDVAATVQQIARLEQAGCDIVPCHSGHQAGHTHPAGGGHPL